MLFPLCNTQLNNFNYCVPEKKCAHMLDLTILINDKYLVLLYHLFNILTILTYFNLMNIILNHKITVTFSLYNFCLPCQLIRDMECYVKLPNVVQFMKNVAM